MKITGTFLDEISCDIPHQNWGEKEWEQDFQAMKAVGIDTVILIRCGHKKFITYPSDILMNEEQCYRPPIDLVDLFLRLSEKYGMEFFFGLYDSAKYWRNGDVKREIGISKRVAEEVWNRYGTSPAFKGWYLNFEVSRSKLNITDLYHDLGMHVKALSGNLPTMISPYIDGCKINQGETVGLSVHERDWNAIFSAIQGAVDIVAFQDGHCDYHELVDYLQVNKMLADRYGMQTWTNCESFDRDMPIRFLPIKWEKMLFKLEAARKAGIDKAITFEFSHFMSPNSMYPSAHGLYDRYREFFGI